MTSFSRVSFSLLLLAALVGCASVPDVGAGVITDKPLTETERSQGRLVQTYADASLLKGLDGFVLPAVSLRLPSPVDGVSDEQLDLLGNALNRSMCFRLADYLPEKSEATDHSLVVRVELTGLTPTSRALTGLSTATGLFVPVRLPIGMGALALDATALTGGETAAVMRWAKGANALTSQAKFSSIGDAYSLVDVFTGDFTDLLLKTVGAEAAARKKRDSNSVRVTKDLCEDRFGKVNSALRGAGWLLPLAPEMIDGGQPDDQDSD